MQLLLLELGPARMGPGWARAEKILSPSTSVSDYTESYNCKGFTELNKQINCIEHKEIHGINKEIHCVEHKAIHRIKESDSRCMEHKLQRDSLN